MVIGTSEAYSQEKKDTLFYPSFRIGAELSYPARLLFESHTKQFEASVDYNFKENIFAVLEGGILTADIQREDFDYYTDGWFFRTGINFNLLGRDVLEDNDIVYVGIRYAYANQKYGADNIIVYDDYWGNYLPPDEQTTLEAHWSELAAGVKTELFSNLFVGWSVRFKVMVSKTEKTLIKPYKISGFGQGIDNTVFGFNYSIYYRLSF